MTETEINEAVARKLGKYPIEETIAWAKSQVTGAGTFTVTVPDYCHDIAAAWEIVEKQEYFYLFKMGDGQWECKLTFFDKRENYALADTAPMAICLAFLKL